MLIRLREGGFDPLISGAQLTVDMFLKNVMDDVRMLGSYEK